MITQLAQHYVFPFPPSPALKFSSQKEMEHEHYNVGRKLCEVPVIMCFENLFS